VLAQMVGQLTDALREYRHLYVSGAGITGMQLVSGCHVRLDFFRQHPLRGLPIAFLRSCLQYSTLPPRRTTSGYTGPSNTNVVSAKLMPAVAIVTDSSACLPAELVQQYGITIVPLAFLFGGEVYHDGDLTGSDFYDRLRDARRPLTTAAPAPGEYLEAFRRVREAGATAVLCLTLSSRYSGAHSSSVKAAEYAGDDLPGLQVRVIDTGGIAMAHGFAVLAAARATAAGGTLDEAAAAHERALGDMSPMQSVSCFSIGRDFWPSRDNAL